ncbi:MAG TPA: hypothetical protein VMV18_02100 [bacterium]|nr:hypothetical protein [bacterium]
MRRHALLLLLLLVPASAFADSGSVSDGSCSVAPADAAGALVSDVSAIAEPAPAPTPAPLDLKTLADRLRATSAVGMFGKLAIKGRVDSLISRASAAQSASERAALRPEFNALLADVVNQLKAGGDPALAKDVSRSSDALWKALLSAQS